METLENLIERAVNEEDHIADVKSALGDQEIDSMAILKRLVRLDEIGLCHYGETGISELNESEAIAVLSDNDNYRWSNNDSSRVDYFLFKRRVDSNVWWQYPSKNS